MEVVARYLGGKKFEATARGHRVISDQPPENGGADEGMTPPEFLLTSLATCAGYYAAEYLNARNLPGEELEVRVRAEKAFHPARLATFEIEVNVPNLDARSEAGILRRKRLSGSQHAVGLAAGGSLRSFRGAFERVGTAPVKSEAVPAQEREEEIELARNLLQGQEQSFDRFVNHFRAKIFRYSWLMCGQREDAEDVAQEALLKVFENFDQLREPERVRPWVFQIARNACLMKRRKSVFAPARELSLDELANPAPEAERGQSGLQIADWTDPPDRAMLHAEMKTVVDQAISALPDAYKSVILMRDTEELSTQETARILELSEDVVKTRLHRARLAVRQKLEEYLRQEGGSDGTRGKR